MWPAVVSLWRAQHDHYESKCERTSGGFYWSSHYESKSEIKSGEFLFAILVALKRCDLGALKERGHCDLWDCVPKRSLSSRDLQFRTACAAKMLRFCVCTWKATKFCNRFAADGSLLPHSSWRWLALCNSITALGQAGFRRAGLMTFDPPCEQCLCGSTCWSVRVGLDILPAHAYPTINSVQTRGIVKTSAFTRRVCKNRWVYIKSKGSLVEFLENRRSWENQKSPEKVDFSEPRLSQWTWFAYCW